MMKKIIPMLAILVAAVLTLPAIASAQRVGLVSATSGKAEIKVGASGNWKSLSLKGAIYTGATVRTGAKGKLKILFEDDSVLTLGSNSMMEINQFVYNPTAKKRKSSFKLLTGRLRAVVSRFFANRDGDDFHVRTPTAVAGVRGTSFLVNISDTKKTQVFVISGEVSVVNILAEIENEVILSNGLMTDILDGEPPSFPETIPQGLMDQMLKDTSVSVIVSRSGTGVNSGQILRAEKKLTGGDGGGDDGGGSDPLAGGGPDDGSGGEPPIDQTPSIPDGFADTNITINFPGAGN
jgi:FecR protein